MSYDGFQIDVYSNDSVTKFGVNSALERLPAALSVTAFLDSNDLNVIKGSLPNHVDLDRPSHRQILDFFSDSDVYRALKRVNLNFGEGDSGRGFVEVDLFKKYDEAEDIYDTHELTSVAIAVIKSRKMSDMKNVARILHRQVADGKLDRRVFDYGGIVVDGLSNNRVEGSDYGIIISDIEDKFTVMEPRDFSGQLEQWIADISK